MVAEDFAKKNFVFFRPLIPNLRASAEFHTKGSRRAPSLQAKEKLPGETCAPKESNRPGAAEGEFAMKIFFFFLTLILTLRAKLLSALPKTVYASQARYTGGAHYWYYAH